MKKKYSLIISFVLLSFIVFSQKRAMTIDDLKSWKRISNKEISDNGQYVIYTVYANDKSEDGKLVLFDDKTKKKKIFNRGYYASIASENNFLIYKIKPQADTLRKKRLAKVKKNKLPKDSLGVYFFEKDTIMKVPQIKSYYLPKKSSKYFAYLYDYKAPKDTTKKDSLQEIAEKKKKKYKQKGARLAIVNAQNLETIYFDNVSKIKASEDGVRFVFSVNKIDSIDSCSIFVYNAVAKTTNKIFYKTGEIANIDIDKKANKIGFSYSSDTCEAKKYQLFYYSVNKKQLRVLLDTVSDSFKKGIGIVDYSPIYFSDAGNRLYFGTAHFPEKAPKDTLLESEKVHLDIWSWTDKLIQPQQKNQLEGKQKETFVSYFDMVSQKIIQLEDSLVKVHIPRKTEPQYYLGKASLPYLEMISWNIDNYEDYYLINAKTGKRTLLAKKKQWSVSISPSGAYTLIWDFENEQWLLVDNKTSKITIISTKVDDIFVNDKHDMPSLRASQGRVGWSEDEQYVYINSKYDIWQFDTKCKKAAINLTKGVGRKQKIEYRFQRLDREAVYLPKDQWLLHSFDTQTMAEGFDLLSIKTLERKTLIQKDKAFYPPIKAKQANKIIWANSTFTQYPNLRISALDFQNPYIISDANPQQKDVLWGSVRLTYWTDFDGDSLRGLLCLPENFNPNKKYPVLIYFYEKYSERLHQYWTPRPSHSTINFPFYTSNNYIVFIPDIAYKYDGLPGKASYNAVVSGAESIAKFPFVDKTKMALQGQSWGGYQVAYLVTQTNMFACAMAGAPVSNMTSAYGGVRWRSGMSRMFQYEHTQSRIGGTLWERRDKYIENSPVFFADRVETPLLIMHNDNDGAVPWYQGIEYFMALRRLQKPVWMLVYNGESHNLRKWPSRVDLTIRMFDFFNYYLKGAEKPEWMIKGLPAIKKGKELRY